MSWKMQIGQEYLARLFFRSGAESGTQDLIAELKLERKTRADAAVAELQTLLKRVSDTITSAKKADELDGLLVDLQKYQNNRNGGYGYTPETQALYQQVSSAFEFTKAWQNYLYHQSTGETQLAENDLQNLSQNNYGVGIIPRSRILERLTAITTTGKGGTGTGTVSVSSTSAVDDILKGIKTLDDMEPALKQLEPLRQNNTQAREAYISLLPLVQVYVNVKAGLPSSINVNFNGNNTDFSISSGLRAQLLVFVLQHYFNSDKETPLTPDEKPQAFIDRVIADAVRREDWPLLKKAFTSETWLNLNSTLGVYTPPNILTGIDNLLAAMNQEAAGQYALAVASYQNVLKTADTTIPAKLIGAKLDAIQKDHPKEYEEGMQMVVSPPVPRYYPGMAPGIQYRPPSNSGSVLPIPGTSTNQVVAPAVPPSIKVPPVK